MLTRVKASAQRVRRYGALSEAKAVKNAIRWAWFKHALRQQVVTYEVQGSTMFLDMQNPGVSKVIAVFGIRERAQTELIKRVLRKGQVVLDIGANIGYYALMEATIVSREGKVYAFEPFPRTFGLLERSVEANNYGDIVETHNVAVGDVPGMTKLYLTEKDNTHITLDPEQYSTASEVVSRNADGWDYVDVESITIDDFMRDREQVDVIRMDVEGFEWKIIDGMMETLERAGTGLKMFIEVHPPYREEDNQFGPRWEKLSAMGFVASEVVSAREHPHPYFAELGYQPQETIFADGYDRGVYTNVSLEDLPALVSHWPPKIVRYIVLEKRESKRPEREPVASEGVSAIKAGV